jgi:hypothetical protein
MRYRPVPSIPARGPGCSDGHPEGLEGETSREITRCYEFSPNSPAYPFGSIPPKRFS